MSKFAYKPGDIIQNECKPFMKTLRRSWKGIRCDNCFQISSVLLRCAGCTTMNYCSSVCQRQDWKSGHKIECTSKAFQEFQQDSEIDPMILRVFRYIAQMKMKPNLADVKHLFNGLVGEEKSMNDLRRAMTSDGREIELATYAWAAVRRRIRQLDPHLDFALNDFVDGSYLFRKHSYILYDEVETEVVGHGLYVETHFLQHSCSPNAFFCSMGTTLRIRAIDQIQAGEPITVCYTEMFAKTVDRQSILYGSYKFVCQCRRCSLGEVEKEIDYEKVKRLIQQFTDSMHKTSDYRFSYFLLLHNEMLDMLRQIYSEYHDTITSQYLRLFALLKIYKGDISYKRLVHLVGKIQNQVAITFGEDHSLYKLFMKEVSVLKIKL